MPPGAGSIPGCPWSTARVWKGPGLHFGPLAHLRATLGSFLGWIYLRVSRIQNPSHGSGSLLGFGVPMEALGSLSGIGMCGVQGLPQDLGSLWGWLGHCWGLGSRRGLYFLGNLWGLGVPLEVGIPLGGSGPLPRPPTPIPAGGPLGDVRAAPAGPGTDSMSEASAAAALPGAGGPGEGGPWGRVLGCPSSPGAHPRVFPSPLGPSWSVAPSLRTHSKVSLSLGPHPYSLGAYPGVSPLPCGTSHSPIGPHP